MATQLCFCGYYGSQPRKCTCPRRALECYRRKVGGPLLDRIDLHGRAESVPVAEWSADRLPSKTSAAIRKRVIEARQLQATRYVALPGSIATPAYPSPNWSPIAPLGTSERHFLLSRIEALQLSARAYSRILKVSRTIADLQGNPSIELEHLALAISFRTLDIPLEPSNRQNRG